MTNDRVKRLRDADDDSFIETLQQRINTTSLRWAERGMSDVLVFYARWAQKNEVGMTIEADGAEAICAMADRIEELEAKLVDALDALKEKLSVAREKSE